MLGQLLSSFPFLDIVLFSSLFNSILREANVFMKSAMLFSHYRFFQTTREAIVGVI